jgi:hypothetical protein
VSFWRFSSLQSFNCTAAAHAQNQTPVQYLLTIEQIIEDDYPVPSYLADVFRKREGWIVTPQAAADARALLRSMRLTEMVRFLTLCNSLK